MAVGIGLVVTGDVTVDVVLALTTGVAIGVGLVVGVLANVALVKDVVLATGVPVGVVVSVNERHPASSPLAVNVRCSIAQYAVTPTNPVTR